MAIAAIALRAGCAEATSFVSTPAKAKNAEMMGTVSVGDCDLVPDYELLSQVVDYGARIRLTWSCWAGIIWLMGVFWDLFFFGAGAWAFGMVGVGC